MQAGKEAGAGLGDAIEEGVAAADIGVQAVELADAVAQLDEVLVTGAAAILGGGAGG